MAPREPAAEAPSEVEDEVEGSKQSKAWQLPAVSGPQIAKSVKA